MGEEDSHENGFVNRHENGFIIESDTLPIINDEDRSERQIVNGTTVHPEEMPVRKKWAALGAVLALSSSLVFTFYGLLIKQFKLDFVDTLFVRSVTQTTLALIFVKIKGKNLLLKFPEDTTCREKTKRYMILIGASILTGMNIMCSFLGVLYLDLGDAMTIIYTGPIFTMIFSFLFLRIRQGLWKISFAGLLMVGVILVIRPPFLFPQHAVHLHIQENNQTFLAETFSIGNENIHWIGVAICFTSSCIGSLIAVSIRYLTDVSHVDSGTVMFWGGLMSILSAFVCLSFDERSQIFILQNIDSTTIGKLFALASLGISANWMGTGSYQLLDPTICAVLRAQEVIFAYVAQAIILHVIPYYLSFVGASFVVLSAICIPLEKYVRPRLPEKLRLIC